MRQSRPSRAYGWSEDGHVTKKTFERNGADASRGAGRTVGAGSITSSIE